MKSENWGIRRTGLERDWRKNMRRKAEPSRPGTVPPPPKQIHVLLLLRSKMDDGRLLAMSPIETSQDHDDINY